MQKIMPSLFVGIAAFLAGLLGALFLTMQLDEHLRDEIALARSNPHFVPEIEAVMNLRHIEAVENGDVEWIVAWHCALLARNLQLLNTTEFEGTRRAQIAELAEKGFQKYQQLSAEGRCGQSTQEIP